MKDMILVLLLGFVLFFIACNRLMPVVTVPSAESQDESSSTGISHPVSDDISSSSTSDTSDTSDMSDPSEMSDGSSVVESEWTPSPEPTPEMNRFRYTKVSQINFRAAPSLSSEILKKLVYGTKVCYLATHGEWTEVVTLDEQVGFLFSDYLSEVPPDPRDDPDPEIRTLAKWPAEFTVQGFYDAALERYVGRYSGEGYRPLEGVTVVLDPGHGGLDGGAVYRASSGKTITEKKINLDIALQTAAVLESMGATVVLTREDDRFLGLYARTAIIHRLILERHREILMETKADTTETDRLIAAMDAVLLANSDAETGDGRGLMKGLGASTDLRTILDISAEHQDILVISLHCNSIANASYVRGLEIYYATNARIYSNESRLLPNELSSNPLNPSYQCYNDTQRRRLASILRDHFVRDTEFELRGNQGLYEDSFCMLRENNVTSVLIEMGYLSNSVDRAFVTDPAGQKRISHAIANGIYEYFCVG
jgi:N-acetylmuramoyl-L-alanine amidase